MQINLKILLLVIGSVIGFVILPLFLESLVIKEISLEYAYFLRFLFASIILVLIAVPFFSWQQIIDKAYLKFFILGLIFQGGGLYTYIFSCQTLGIASATVFTYAFYIWIILYERLFLDKKSNLGQSFGILLLFVGGIALLKFNPVLNLSGSIGLMLVCQSFCKFRKV